MPPTFVYTCRSIFQERVSNNETKQLFKCHFLPTFLHNQLPFLRIFIHYAVLLFAICPRAGAEANLIDNPQDSWATLDLYLAQATGVFFLSLV